MPQCRCVEHGLEYFSFYVQKHIAHLPACSGPPAGSRWAVRGTRISETHLFRYDTSMALCKTAISPLVNALEVLQSCLLLHEIFTYKNMALSLINMQFDSREVSKHHVHDDEEEHSNPTGENKSPDSKVHGANMGPIWGRQDPIGPHVGPTNFAI